MKLRYPFFLAVALALLGGGQVRGVVIASDAQIVNRSGWNEVDPSLAPLAIFPTPYAGPYLSYDRQFVLTQTLVPGEDGLFLLEVASISPTRFAFTYSGIAEAYSLYLPLAGDILGVDYVNSQPSFVNNWAMPATGILDIPVGDSVLIGYWDDRSSDGMLPATAGDVFGWARVSNSRGELIVVESATALGGGIVVGALQQVPEPSIFGLCFSAFGLFAICRRRASLG